jgi:hypothetical protein
LLGKRAVGESGSWHQEMQNAKAAEDDMFSGAIRLEVSTLDWSMDGIPAPFWKNQERKDRDASRNRRLRGYNYSKNVQCERELVVDWSGSIRKWPQAIRHHSYWDNLALDWSGERKGGVNLLNIILKVDRVAN